MNTAKQHRSGIRKLNRTTNVELNRRLDRPLDHRLDRYITRMNSGVRRPRRPNLLADVNTAIAALIRRIEAAAKIDPAFDYAAITRWGLECGKTKRDPEWEDYVQRTYGKKCA